MCVSGLTSSSQSLDPLYYVFGVMSQDYSYGAHGGEKKNLPHSRLAVKLGKEYIARHAAEMKRIEEVTSLEFKPVKPEVSLEECPACDTTYVLTMKKRSWQLNRFYKFDKPKLFCEWTSPTRGKVKSWSWTSELRKEMLLEATRKEKLSFLAGAFLAFQETQKDTISFGALRAPAKIECIKELLIEFGCTIIIDELKDTDNPSIWNDFYSISFIPTDEILRLINEEVESKKRFANTTNTN